MLPRCGLVDRTRALAATSWLLAAASLTPGCATSTVETRPAAPAPAPTASLRGLRVRVRGEASPLDRELAAALETELARAGVVVLTDDRQPSDAQLRPAVDVRVAGPVVEGIGTVSVEHDGTLVDRLSTSLDVYRRDHFPAAVAHELAELLAKSPRVEAFARAGRGEAPPSSPVAEAIPPPPAFIPPPPAPATPPPVAAPPPPAPTPLPSATPPPAPTAFSRSGAFGVGVSLEVDLGWAQVVGPGASPAGAVVALALQADVTHRAAFRMPASFAVAGSGDDTFGHLALSPALLYRFLDDTDQRWVPYVGLGLRLGVMVAGRHLLGRPVTGVPTADSCSSRRNQSPSHIEDCAFTISPEPMVGIEWHTSRLFSLDLAATYSFVHVTSSEGLVSWVHLVQFYVGPRFSF